MRDSRKKKLRDLRRIARSRGYNPSIYDLFHRYHPEIKEWEDQTRRECRDEKTWYILTTERNIIYNLERDWVIKIAGYWDAIGGAPPSHFRRTHNRLRRARQRQALRCAARDDAWDDFMMPRERRNIRREWW